MILVDTSVWIDFLRNTDTKQADHLARVLTSDHGIVVTGDLIVMELLQGAKDDFHAQRIIQRLAIVPTITICDRALAVKAAANYRFLRARGITMRKTIDTLIATRCVVDDYPLLYSDRDFDPFVEHLGLRSALAS